jgi:hypothetical protein
VSAVTAHAAGRAPRALQLYLWVVMAGLLVQGAGSLLLDLRPDVRAATPILLATIMNGNPPHAWLHIVWGVVGLAVLMMFRSAVARVWLGLAFGTFYTLLGFLGIAVHHPMAMRLELPENVFHLTVGPLMLLLTWLASRDPVRGRLAGTVCHR